jgi:hypothetical protein
VVSELVTEAQQPVSMPQQKVVTLAVEWVVVDVMVGSAGLAAGPTEEMAVPVVFAVAAVVVVVRLVGPVEVVVVVLVVPCWPPGWHRPQSHKWGRILRCLERFCDSQGRCEQRS